MGTDPAANLHNNSGEMPKSYFKTIVFLDDWWLVKAQKDLRGTRIFIAGYTVEEKKCRRLCSLLPIQERNEEHHLETTDGKCVIIRGRHNEALSAENGFASNICKHFGWGFPPYWKEFAEKYMVKKSPCMNDVQPSLEELPSGGKANIGSDDSNLGSQGTKANKKRTFEKTKSSAVPLLHKAGNNRTPVRGDQPNSGIPAINLGSEGKEDDKSHKTKKKPKRSKLSAVPLLQKTDSPIIGPENDSSISYGTEALFNGGPSIGDGTTEDMTVNCINSMNSFGKEVDTFSCTDKYLDDSEIGDSVRNSHTDDGLQANKVTHSSENIASLAKGRPETRSSSRLNKKHDGQASTMIPAKGICKSAAISGEVDTDSVMGISDQPPENMKVFKKVKTRGNLQKKDRETKSLDTSASTGNGGLQEMEEDKDENWPKDILIPSRGKHSVGSENISSISHDIEELFDGGRSLGDRTTEDMPVNCMNSLNSFGEEVNTFAFSDKDLDDSEIDDSVRNSHPDDGLHELQADMITHSSENIVILAKGRPETRSSSRLNKKHDGQASTMIPAKGICISAAISGEVDTDSVMGISDAPPENMKDLKKVKTRGNLQKKDRETKSLGTFASTVNDGLQEMEEDKDKNLPKDILIPSRGKHSVGSENISSISHGIEELFDEGRRVGDRTTEDMLVSCMNSLNSFGEKVDTFAFSDKDLDDSEIGDSVRNSHPVDGLHEMQADMVTHSSENIVILAKGRPETRSSGRLNKKHDGQASTMIPAKGICISAAISGEVDTDYVMGISDQPPENMKDLKKVKTRGNLQKKDRETKSLGTSASTVNGGLQEMEEDKDKNLPKDILIPSRGKHSVGSENISNISHGIEELFDGGRSVGDRITEDMPVSCINSLNSFGEKVDTFAFSDKDLDDPKIGDSVRNSHPVDGLHEMQADMVTHLSENIVILAKGRPETRSSSRLNKKHDGQASAMIPAKDICISAAILGEVDTDSVMGISDQPPESMRDLKKVKTRGNLQKKDKETKSLGTSASTDNGGLQETEEDKEKKLPKDILFPSRGKHSVGSENISSISHCIEEVFDGGRSLGDRTTEDMAVNCMNSLNSFGEEVDTFAFTDKDLDDSEIDDSVRNSHPDDGLHELQADKVTHSSLNIVIVAKGRPETRSSSRLNKKHDGQASTMLPPKGICISAAISGEVDTDSVMGISDQLPETIQDLKKVKTRGSMQKKDKETKLLGTSTCTDNCGLRETEEDKYMKLSKDILIPSRGSPEKHSVSRLDTKHNNQASATISVSGLFRSEDKSSDLNPVSVKDKSQKPSESVNQVKDQRIETRSNTQKKANSKATKSPSTSVSTDDDGLWSKELDKNKNMPKRPLGRAKKQKKNIPGTGPSGSEDISAEDNFEKLLEPQKQVKDGVKFKTASQMQQKENDRTTKSFRGPTSADTGKQTASVDTEKGTIVVDTNLSEKATPASMNRRRKIEFETPDGGNEKVAFNSPQSSSFKRSRSGRVQMRRMEYWRNEIPIYSPDRTFTAVTEEGNAGQPGIGSISADKRTERKLF